MGGLAALTAREGFAFGQATGSPPAHGGTANEVPPGYAALDR